MRQDEEIVALMRKGDESGLEMMMRCYGPAVLGNLRFRFVLTRDDSAMHQAFNEASFKLFKRAHRLNPTNGNLRGYYLKVAERELGRLLRRRRDRAWRFQQLNEVQAEETRAAESNLLSERVRALIDSLPEMERAVFEFDAGTGFTGSAAEAARALGTTVGAVYSFRNRTKKRLSALRDELGDAGAELAS